MKRKALCSVLLVCVLIFYFCVPTFALSNDFADISSSAWYYIGVGYCSERNIMVGVGNRTFGPNLEVSRAMMVQVLYNLKGMPVESSAPFDDTRGAWYTLAVDWAYSNSIVAGESEKSFAPNKPITRQDLVTILYRFTQKYGGVSTDTSVSLHTYDDSNQVAAYAYEAMSWAVGMGLISGTSSSTLSPRAQTTRDQLATIVMRYCMLSDANSSTIAVPSNRIEISQQTSIPIATALPEGSSLSYRVLDSSSSILERDFEIVWGDWNGSIAYLRVSPRVVGWVELEISNDYNDRTIQFTVVANELTHVPYSDAQFTSMGKEAYNHLLSILKNPSSLQVHKVYAGFFEGNPILVFDYSAMNGFGGYVRSNRAFWYNAYHQIASGTGSIFNLDRLQDVYEIPVESVCP